MNSFCTDIVLFFGFAYIARLTWINRASLIPTPHDWREMRDGLLTVLLLLPEIFIIIVGVIFDQRYTDPYFSRVVLFLTVKWGLTFLIYFTWKMFRR